MPNNFVAGAPATLAQRSRPLTVLIGALVIAVVFAAYPVPAHAAAKKAPDGYLVKKGDTLTSIAGKLKMNAAALAARNGIVEGRIFAGTRLLLDVQVPAKSLPAGGGYVVMPGDTLSGIARKLSLNPTALAARNGIINGNVYSGARLLTSVSAAGMPPVPAQPFLARRAGSDKVVRCPVNGQKQFMNDWGFTRSGGRWHQGTDIMAKRGAPVVAPAPGTVTKADNRLGGKAVKLRTADGTVFYFAHLDGYGATGPVAAGAVIGKVGSSGGAKGGPAHVHLEIRPGGGAAVNPYPTVREGCA